MKDLVFCYTFSMKTMKLMPPPQRRATSAQVVCMSWVMVAWHFSKFHWFRKDFAIYFQEKTIKINVLHNCCAKTNLHVCKLDLVMSWSITCIKWPQQITWFACCQNIETCVKGKHVKVFVTTQGGGALQRIAPHKEAPQRAPKRTGQSYDLRWIGACYWALTQWALHTPAYGWSNCQRPWDRWPDITPKQTTSIQSRRRVPQAQGAHSWK